MQTFLPYSDFYESAKTLDPSRLGNQFYREGLTILRGGWPHHPISKMWKGFTYSLCEYLLACHKALNDRGKFYPKHEAEILEYMDMAPHHWVPPWLGDEDIHASHRANLLRKDPDWYGKFGWTEEPQNGYVWVVDGRKYRHYSETGKKETLQENYGAELHLKFRSP